MQKNFAQIRVHKRRPIDFFNPHVIEVFVSKDVHNATILRL